MRTLLLNVDGGSRGNPGPAGIGVVVRDSDGQVIAEISESIGRATSNVAEYKALIRGLKECRSLEADRVLVYSDSELLVRQMVGQYKVKKPHLVPLHQEATLLARGFSKVGFKPIPREQNRHADKLAGQAIKDAGKGNKVDETLQFDLVNDEESWT